MLGIVRVDYFYDWMADGRAMGEKKQSLATIQKVYLR